jgi:hypothetical protein
MGENVGAQGAIYRGRAGHRRGARGKQRSPSMAAFNSHVTGAEENGSAPFTRGEREGRLRGAHFYVEEAARGTRPAVRERNPMRRRRFCSTKKTTNVDFGFYAFEHSKRRAQGRQS